MGGAYYIMMVNLAIGIVLLGGFTAFWLYDRRRKAPLLLALATLLFLGSSGLELAAPFVDPDWHSSFRFLLYTINFAAALMLAVAVGFHYKLKPHWNFVALWSAAGLLLTWAVLDMERNSLIRLFLNQTPMAATMAIATIRVVLVPHKHTLDKVLVGALSLFALNLIGRPLLLAFGSMGSSVSDFHESQFALIATLSLAIVTMITACVLMLVMVADLVADLVRKSQTDSLSRLYNRRGFEERSKVLLNQADRSSTPLSIIVCDIDHFKAINDTYGHAAGDSVIAGMGELLQSSTRKTDLTSRIGGEEFCILLWNAGLNDAVRLAESIRHTLENIAFDELDDQHRITASFGVAQWHPVFGTEQKGIDALFEQADKALYQAKAQGRNRVCRALPPKPVEVPKAA